MESRKVDGAFRNSREFESSPEFCDVSSNHHHHHHHHHHNTTTVSSVPTRPQYHKPLHNLTRSLSTYTMPSELHTSRTRKWLLSSPPVEWASTQLKELFINSVRQGPVPQHVAFVMDGNRRFARKNHIETVEGHNMGFEALAKVPFHYSSPNPNSICL